MRCCGWLLLGFILTLPALAGEIQVIDGDTLWVAGAPVRLWGIDAPERGQSCHFDGAEYDCGAVAASILARLIGDRPLRCLRIDTDRYGRTVARCAVNERDLGSMMVAAGWALDYRHYSRGVYNNEQRRAQRAKRGLWAGEFQCPWAWRKSAPRGDSRKEKMPVQR